MVEIHKNSKTIFGMRLGEKNIGIAVRRFKIKIAHPLCVISSNSNEILKEKFLVLLNECGPLSKLFMDFLFMKMEASMNLCHSLKNSHFSIFKKYNSEYCFINELLSSNLASNLMNKTKNKRIDSLSAMIILDDFFNLEDN